MNERELTILLVGVVMSVGFFIMAFLQYRVYKVRKDRAQSIHDRMKAEEEQNKGEDK